MLFSKNKPLPKYKLPYLFACLSALLVFSSCEDPNELGLGLVEDNVQGNFIDTLTVNVSTVLLDSVATSGMGNLLVGQYAVPAAGTLTSSTFFQIGLGETWAPAADATVDSISLVLTTTGDYYGDTTAALTFNVNEVTSPIKSRPLSPIFPNEEPRSLFYQNNGLYNTSNVAVAEAPLATYTFKPTPAKDDTLEIALPDALGQQWLTLRKENNTNLTENDGFVNFFKGLNLAPVDGRAVVAFAPTATVRLYYSETVNGAKVTKSHNFPLINTSLQFNRITNDFTGAALEGIVRGEALPAQVSGGVSVLQGGSGLMIKLEIPHLERLKEKLMPEFINQAVLIVEPLEGSMTEYPYPVPSTLTLYRTNDNNVPLVNLTSDFSVSSEPEPLTSNYIKGAAGANGRYEFIITEYIIDMLNDERMGADNALLLAPLSSQVATTVSRLAVGAQGKAAQNIRLKVYYTTIK